MHLLAAQITIRHVTLVFVYIGCHKTEFHSVVKMFSSVVIKSKNKYLLHAVHFFFILQNKNVSGSSCVHFPNAYAQMKFHDTLYHSGYLQYHRV